MIQTKQDKIRERINEMKPKDLAKKVNKALDLIASEVDVVPAKRRAYIILPTERAEDGGYIPCICEENEPGYWRTDWNWGDDWGKAEEIAMRKNRELGLTDNEAFDILLSSLAKQRTYQRRTK